MTDVCYSRATPATNYDGRAAGRLVAIGIQGFSYVVTGTPPAGQPFDPAEGAVALIRGT